MSDIINKESFGLDWINDVEASKPERSQLLGDDIKNFIFGGNATFTIVNTDSKKYFPFKVRKSKDSDEVFFVSIMNHSVNNYNHNFLGTFFSKDNCYKTSKKSSIKSDTTSSKVISWFFNYFINSEEKYPTVQVYHDGKCGKCGRKLTTPESVKSGLGPICGGKNR